MKRPVLIVLAVLVGFPAIVQADGALYLERYSSNPEPGVAHAQLFVYGADGSLIHSGRGAGAHQAGEPIEVPEGWYWVEAGQHRNEHNLQRLYVSDGQTTVVPSGWVSVSTLAEVEQPAGCEHWNATLSAFRVDEAGQEYLVISNQGTGVYDFGMIQLPVGDFVVYFNEMPTEVSVQAGQTYRLPTGYQDPVVGERPQIATRAEGEPRNHMRSLCERGLTHLPARDYWVSRIVPTRQYPYEERVWDRVSVLAEGDSGYTPARAERVSDRYEGTGSQPDLTAQPEPSFLENYRRGALTGVRTSGFEGALPGLDL